MISGHTRNYLQSNAAPVIGRTQYDVYAWMRGGLDAEGSTQNAENWALRVRFYSDSGGVTEIPDSMLVVDAGDAESISATWERVGGSVTTPAGAASVRVELLDQMTTGWITFDDVSLSRLITAKNYYYAGATRVAMRVDDDDPLYILGDHLGSTTLVVDKDGNDPVYMLYKPWGETRHVSGAMPTDYGFTGQRNESELGLYFYGSRFYDPYLNRWIQPDSIIPDLGNSADFDRYAYVRNNPLRFIDPSGHIACGRDAGMLGGCTREDDPFTDEELKDAISYDYRIPESIVNDLSNDELENLYTNPLEFLMEEENRQTLLALEKHCNINPDSCIYSIHREFHWEELTDVFVWIEYSKLGGMTAATFVLGVGFIGLGYLACTMTAGIGCVAIIPVAAIAAGASFTGSILLGYGTYLYTMKHLYEFDVRFK